MHVAVFSLGIWAFGYVDNEDNWMLLGSKFFKRNRQSFHPPRLNDWPFFLKTLLPNYIHLLSLSSSSKLKYSPMAFVMPQLRIADYDTRNKFDHTTFLVPVICLYLSFEIVHVYVHNDDDVDVYQ